MQRIEKLTAAQEAEIPRIRDEWLRHGLSTEPADRERAERAVDLAYVAGGLAPPTLKIWLRSPLEGAVGAAMLQASPPVGAQVGDQVWDQVWAQVGDQVWAQVGDQVWDQVWAQVRAQVWAQVGDQVWDQVRAQVWAQVGAQVRAQVWDQVYSAGYGQHGANWLAWSSFFQEACGLAAPERLEGLYQLAQSAGWWWPFEGAVILTERHHVLRRDDQHRLHAPDGPALLYPDGFGVWAWHGLRVSQQVIESPESLTVEQIRDERNVEIRRVMLERFGQDRYLRESGAQMIHRDDWGTLWRADVPDDEPICMVSVVNSTPEPDGSFREFMIRVPPDMQTAHQAVAWSFEETEETYAPLVQT